MLSIVIPVFRNEKNIDRLVQELERIAGIAPMPIEAVLVVDGSPDRSLESLRERLPSATFSSTLVSLSRNFGAFNAVRCGLEQASGDYMAVLAADLQEPADLALTFLDILKRDEADIVFATRSSRDDPWFDEITSDAFWSLYRRWVLPELPPRRRQRRRVHENGPRSSARAPGTDDESDRAVLLARVPPGVRAVRPASQARRS